MNVVTPPGAQSPNIYYDPYFKAQAAKILPGGYFATSHDVLIVTVLGTCVAACVRDRQSGIGGMNHFMLPDSGSDASMPVEPSARHGAEAMERLINAIVKRGARRDQLEARVFGGGSAIPGLRQSEAGGRNASFVLDFLKRESIPVVEQDLHGEYPRKVYFFPKTGRAVVKKLETVRNDTIARREREYRERLGRACVGDDVELL